VKDHSVDRVRLAYLLRRAVALPPHRAIAKAVGFARRHARGFLERRIDLGGGSHSLLDHGVPWRNRVLVTAADIPVAMHEPLRLLGACYRAHRFDLLGSGWVEVRYGMTCRGFAGRSYPPHPAANPDRDGAWLAGEINASNLTAARDLWRRIGDASYRPIDWQLDFRSGYRWHAGAHFSALPIPVDTGADVKVPWELGRLQHLPQLALCAVLAAAGAEDFAPAADYVGELRNQLLDFLALNPPRFGVNWMCPMDVGIRVANMLMAMDILIGAGLDPDLKFIDQDFIDIVLRSARDHAAHIADHPEWSEGGRGNHYLANLIGLLWAASYLPPAPPTDAWFAFAAAELLREGARQFGPDGGNYEGSTNYHRLSAELVLFGVALLSGLSEDDLARVDHARGDALRIIVPWRAGPLPRYPLPERGRTIVPPELREKLHRAGRMVRACTRPDGRVMQIGDTDSGRLFKLMPAGRADEAGRGRTFSEDALDHRATAVAIETLFGVAHGARTVDAIVVECLAGGRIYPLPIVAEIVEHGDIDAVIRSIAALPDDCRRRRYFPFAKPVAPEAWRRAAFVQFGLYNFATNDAFIGFRCAAPPPAGAPLGHTHDDNLAVEYVLGNEHRIDPGTVCYTPSRVLRDAYRGAGAHDVPRAIDWEIAAPGSELFGLAHAAWAECLAFGPAGVAGRIVAHRGTLLRALRLTETGLEIWDGVHPPDRLRPVAPQIEVADGYGRIARSVRRDRHA
jgi:hypothetical protein